MSNLARLLARRREVSASRRFGLIADHEPYGDAFDRAARTAATLRDVGLPAGSRAAVVGTNSRDYLQAWVALQLGGVQAALVNPTYPPALLREMLGHLGPDAVVWVGIEPQPDVCRSVPHVDLSGIVAKGDGGAGSVAPSTGAELPGLDCRADDVAGFMHTSGTTGVPKFCQQTHEYFLRLARYIADTMTLGETDVVFAPLPLFHINPLGYGVLGGLFAGAAVVSAARFSARRFWSDVRDAGVTALILHAPPVEVLKRSTVRADSRGHRVRVTFFADAGFLDEFRIPVGLSGYGSTEAGGLCHTWLWRRGETADLPEGQSRYGGAVRPDVEWRLTGEGEIQVRAARPGVLFDGYWADGELVRPFDAAGWFSTGDLGRIDELGNLVFVERRTESIRVKGEFVPIGYVEEHFARLDGIDDVALWRQPSDLVDDEVALYVTAAALDRAAIESARATLPSFMRPAVVVRVAQIPRDAGVGKVRRRELDHVPVIETVRLT